MASDLTDLPGSSGELPPDLIAKLKIAIDGYSLMERIGSGGQAVVFKAKTIPPKTSEPDQRRRPKDGTLVAIKILHEGPLADEAARARLDRERRHLEALKNDPRIVTVIDSGQTAEGHVYMVTEFIDGKPLSDFYPKNGHADAPPSDRLSNLRLLSKVCEAMNVAHLAGVTHRDLSPSNILVDKNNEPHILDFGLARSAFDRFFNAQNVTKTGQIVLGKWHYASPEQAQGDPERIDIRADVYALGVILYKMVTGRYPYEIGSNLIEALENIIGTRPAPMNLAHDERNLQSKQREVDDSCRAAPVDAVLEAIVLKALEKNPNDRYQSSGELGRDVANYLDGKPTVARPANGLDREPSFLHPIRQMNSSPVARSNAMHFSGIPQRQSLIQWAHQIREIARSRNDDCASEAIEAAIGQLQAERFVITIMGKAKRGKSTLLNALLGRTDDLVAPIDKLPASSAISKFHWSEADQATITFRDGRSAPVAFDQIRQFVTEEGNPGNSKGVDLVDIGGPFVGLERDVILVDTPGAGSIHEHHDALLHNFLPQSDAVVFLVTARMPIDQDELELLRAVNAADIRKIFFAVNRADEATPRDLDDAVRHNQGLLAEAGVTVDQIHRISAKRAFQGNLPGSGVPQLFQEIQRFLGANKVKLLEARFISRVCQAVTSLAQSLDVELASAGKTAEEIGEELRRLVEKKRLAEQSRALSEQEFKASWYRSMDDFSRSLPDAKSDLTMQIGALIEETPLSRIGALKKELPTALLRAIEQRLAGESQRLEESLRSACSKLNASYPSVAINNAGGVSIRVKESGTFVKGSVGGAAAAAVGVGLVTAGTATAATIATTNAAILAAATASVPVTTFMSSLLASIPVVGSWLAPLATGTAVVTAPATLIATPLWVAMSGPVGWSLAGIGAIAAPLAWRISKLRLKDDLDRVSRQQIDEVFKRIATDRIGGLRSTADSIVMEFQVALERQLQDIEAALIRARDRHPDEKCVAAMRAAAADLRRLISETRCGPAQGYANA